MGFSSRCAIELAYLRPAVPTGCIGDDQDQARLGLLGVADDEQRRSGDSQAGFASLETQIAAGIPIPCGDLHGGSLSSSAGGGRWRRALVDRRRHHAEPSELCTTRWGRQIW